MKKEEVKKIKDALKKDFHKLYVKEFTTTWELERLVRDTEIDVMSLDNLCQLFQPPDVCPCPTCQGTGKKIVMLPMSGQQVKVDCETCKGTGKKPSDVEKIINEVEERLFTRDGDGNLILRSAMDSARIVRWWKTIKGEASWQVKEGENG